MNLTRYKRIAGRKMAYGPYVYQTDSGKYCYFYQWDFLASQLSLGGKAIIQPYWRELVTPRYIIYSDISYGYRLKIIVPYFDSPLWNRPPTIGWFGYLYKPMTWVAEVPNEIS